MKSLKKKENVMLFAKEKFGLDKAILYLETHFSKVDIFTGKVGDSFPIAAKRQKANICISYLSPWIIPEEVLRHIKKFAINFHPGLPSYRGIGCTNFAIYNEEKTFGVTAHLMEPQVDSGRIINVMRFPVFKDDTLWSMTNKCYVFTLFQFYYIFDYYLLNGKLPRCNEPWSRKLYTRKELNELCKLKTTMSKDEIKKRIKATKFPNMPGAYFEIVGRKVEAD